MDSLAAFQPTAHDLRVSKVRIAAAGCQQWLLDREGEVRKASARPRKTALEAGVSGGSEMNRPVTDCEE